MNMNAVFCDECQLILEQPITLPCGKTICRQHLGIFDDTFSCKFCNNEHKTPQDGFCINKNIEIMIGIYFDLNPLKKEIKDSFDSLNAKIHEYEDINADIFVYDYFADIRNKVDLHRDELIKEITERSERILNELKQKEEKCNLKKAKIEKESLSVLKENDLVDWKQKLTVAEINEEELIESLSIMNDHIKHIQRQIQKYKNNLLNDESIEFDKIEQSSLFGHLNTKKVHFTLSNDCGMLIKSFDDHYRCINSIQVDVNSKRLITASDDETIKIWDLQTLRCLRTLEGHTNYVQSILLIPNSNTFISGSNDETIKIWDLFTFECLNTLEIQKNIRIKTLCLISDNVFACGCEDGSIVTWEIHNIDNFTQSRSFKAHDSSVIRLKSVDNLKLISSSYKNNIIKVWDSITFDCIKVLEGHIYTIAQLELTPVWRNLLTASGNTVKLWHIESGEMLKSIEFEWNVDCIKVLKEELIAVALDSGEIQIYDLANLINVKTIKANSDLDTFYESDLSFPVDYVSELCFLSNRYLLSGFGTGEIKLWEVLD